VIVDIAGLTVEWEPDHVCEHKKCEYCDSEIEVKCLSIEGFLVRSCRSCFERLTDDRHIFQIDVRHRLRRTLN
jgi:ribosome-binding protein aMBF1 (putative translation factor)